MPDIILNRIPSFIIVLLVLLPNLLMVILPPRNVPKGAGGLPPILDITEKAGRIAVFVIPLFYGLELNKTVLSDKIALGGMLLTLAFYYAGWARFLLKGRYYALLFSPLLSIPVPMAIFPLLYFAFSALLLKSWPQLIAAVIFAAGHIPFAYSEYIKSKGNRLMKPEFIRASQEGSFAWLTVTKRLPYIVGQIIENNELTAEQLRELEKLKAEIPYDNIQPLKDKNGCYNVWCDILRGHTKTWIDEPFFFVEFYLYRRIAEAVGFFSSGFDPFKYAKLESLHGKIHEIAAIASHLDKTGRPFRELLLYNLWGNRADLSQFHQPGSYMPGGGKNIIINDIDRAAELLERGLGQVDILLDNSGLELAVDLISVFHLVGGKAAGKVYLHAKPCPIFVSDAMPDDILHTVECFKDSGDAVLRNIGKKLSAYIEEKTVVIRTDPFWVLPEPFESFTPGLSDHFGKSDLVVAKGDLNYRRLVEDRCWDYSADIGTVVGYFPANLLVIRSLKSELMLGITAETTRRLFNEDPDWRVNGKFGMVQLILKK